jgi:hypothetical protein
VCAWTSYILDQLCPNPDFWRINKLRFHEANCSVASELSPTYTATCAAWNMATDELRTPLVRRHHRPRLAVEAMTTSASLLMLLVLAVFFDSSVAVVTGSPELVELTLVPGAREKGAGLQASYCDVISFVYLEQLFDGCVCGRCSLLGREPAGLPSTKRLWLWIPQLARLSSGNRITVGGRNCFYFMRDMRMK